jgi:hypothetical protein
MAVLTDHIGMRTGYFLDKKRLEDEAQTVAEKPVFTGCDAHSFDELG